MKTERDGVTVGWMRQPMNPSLNTMHRLRSICSLNPTGDSTALIVNLPLAQILPGGLIRALDTLRENMTAKP